MEVEAKSKRRFPQQLIPLIILFAVAIAALLVIRALLIPKTFGEFGHYRSAAVGEIAGIPMVYAGFKVCIDCHDDIYQKKQESSHKGLACETCHGPAAAHATAPDSTQPKVPRTREDCLQCHNYNPSRPTGFPQVIATTHNPGKACISCHDSHSPRLERTADECGTCHGEIANQKAVSHHVSLPCTRCHTVPKEHVVEPRFARAQKPSSRELCGECHAKGANSPPEIPRIDLANHGVRYVCWECHYPHYPEAKI